MSQATIAVPPSVTEGEARLYLSMKLFEIGRLSCGQAAELAGYSKRTYTLVSRKKCTNPCSCETIVCTIPVASAAWCDRQA